MYVYRYPKPGGRAACAPRRFTAPWDRMAPRVLFAGGGLVYAVRAYVCMHQCALLPSAIRAGPAEPGSGLSCTCVHGGPAAAAAADSARPAPCRFQHLQQRVACFAVTVLPMISLCLCFGTVAPCIWGPHTPPPGFMDSCRNVTAATELLCASPCGRLTLTCNSSTLHMRACQAFMPVSVAFMPVCLCLCLRPCLLRAWVVPTGIGTCPWYLTLLRRCLLSTCRCFSRLMAGGG